MQEICRGAHAMQHGDTSALGATNAQVQADVHLVTRVLQSVHAITHRLQMSLL
jgi:hypothetical protein